MWLLGSSVSARGAPCSTSQSENETCLVAVVFAEPCLIKVPLGVFLKGQLFSPCLLRILPARSGAGALSPVAKGSYQIPWPPEACPEPAFVPNRARGAVSLWGWQRSRGGSRLCLPASPAAFPGCPAPSHSLQAAPTQLSWAGSFPALPLRNCSSCGTTESSGGAGWVPAPGKHISLKTLLQSLTQSLSWSPGREAGAGMLGVNLMEEVRGVPEWKKP